jgi:hypothetical protein
VGGSLVDQQACHTPTCLWITANKFIYFIEGPEILILLQFEVAEIGVYDVLLRVHGSDILIPPAALEPPQRRNAAQPAKCEHHKKYEPMPVLGALGGMLIRWIVEYFRH